jgi:hypothetical protein
MILNIKNKKVEVNITDNNCWEVTNYKVSFHGYPRFTINGKAVRIFRIYYFDQVLKIDLNKDIHILHSCNNRKCINLEHLRAGTYTDNMNDVAKSGIRKGVNNYRCKLSEHDIILIRSLYSTGNYTQKYLAKVFDVSESQISLIVNNKEWRHI